MDEPSGQAFKDLAGLTANSPDTGGRIIAVIELEGGTRLISGTLLDDCLRESLVAVDENLRSAASILSSFYHVTTTENILPHVRQERHGSHHHTSWSTDRSFEHGPFSSGCNSQMTPDHPSCQTHLHKVSNERKTGGTRKRNSMRGSAENLVK